MFETLCRDLSTTNGGTVRYMGNQGGRAVHLEIDGRSRSQVFEIYSLAAWGSRNSNPCRQRRRSPNRIRFPAVYPTNPAIDFRLNPSELATVRTLEAGVHTIFSGGNIVAQATPRGLLINFDLERLGEENGSLVLRYIYEQFILNSGERYNEAVLKYLRDWDCRNSSCESHSPSPVDSSFTA